MSLRFVLSFSFSLKSWPLGHMDLYCGVFQMDFNLPVMLTITAEFLSQMHAETPMKSSNSSFR